ncbi:uncharacterized protein LOC130821611 [Amaranthus tricolor]|uniref:uncharacterized protein LOC130821611 n=1 Tax=Amaranthus tricolor TaxID=29722 RepID=UPI00258C8C95|nr:uncharacterized protein LOC130821611 [Amaranthus tricolor]
MVCISSTQYSLLVNGCPYEIFTPRRGLRQGDPLSPFSLSLAWSISLGSTSLLERTTFSSSIPDVKAYNLTIYVLRMTSCFSTGVKAHLPKFFMIVSTSSSGMVANASKSALYLATVPEHIKGQIANLVHHQLGSLPFRKLILFVGAYIWHADPTNTSPDNVNWHDVCKPKKLGSLEFETLLIGAKLQWVNWHGM